MTHTSDSMYTVYFCVTVQVLICDMVSGVCLLCTGHRLSLTCLQLQLFWQTGLVPVVCGEIYLVTKNIAPICKCFQPAKIRILGL